MTSKINDILYVIDNDYEVRYYWSIKSLVGAYAGGWANIKSRLHVFSKNGVQVPIPSQELLLEARQEALSALQKKDYNAVIQKYTLLIEQSFKS